VRDSRVALFCTMAGLLIAWAPPGALARDSGSGPRPLREATSRLVQELDFVFIPDPTKIQLGQTVHWMNVTHNGHTATGDAPLSLWDSGFMAPTATFDYTFTAAGQYPYLCLIHERYDMVSAINVRDQVSPPSGPVGTVFTVTVATIPAPDDYVYDIQKRDPGGQWADWMTGITATNALFDSTGSSPGTYRFRSRLHRVSDDAASDYSPPAAISVTP